MVSGFTSQAAERKKKKSDDLVSWGRKEGSCLTSTLNFREIMFQVLNIFFGLSNHVVAPSIMGSHSMKLAVPQKSSLFKTLGISE